MYGTSNRAEALLSENTINIRYYWNVLMLNKWWILALAVAAAFLAVFVAGKIDPLYRATTTVLIENSEAKLVSIDDVYGLNTRNKEYFLTQFEILKSRELAQRVIERLQLETHPEFDPRQKESFNWREHIPESMSVLKEWFPVEEAPQTAQAIRMKVQSTFIDRLSISPISNTQLVKINFEANTPELAAQIANEMADVYIESNLEARLQMTQKAAGWLTSRLDGLKTKLKESEERLQAYREKETLVDVSGVKTLNTKELNELTQRLVDASNVRSAAQNAMEQVRALGTSPTVEQLLELPSILQHELVRSLKTRQADTDRKIAELSDRYGARHPVMVAAQAEAKEARTELERQVLRVARGLSSDYQLALESQRSAEQQLNQAKQRAQLVNRKEFRLSELEREVETNRQLYDMFMTRAKETDETGNLQSAHARIIDAAFPPRVPVAPKTDLMVLLAVFAALAIGVMLSFLRDALDNTIKTPEDVEEKLKSTMVGFLPLTKARRKDVPVEGFLTDNFSSFAEAVRSLRTGMMLSSIDEPHKVIVITSTLPGEGKSTVALNLAEALGQMEKVLLIEADLRRPVLAKTLKIRPNARGLSNLVSGIDELKICIRSFQSLGIDVITAGVLPSNPQELLSSKRFGLVIELLKKQYDRIIIDSPPTNPVSDAMILSSYADAVVYVVRAGETSASLAAKGIKRLREVRAPIVGVVLNQVNLKKKNLYGEDYSGYAKGYGYAPSPMKTGQEKSPDSAVA